ncbi:MAG: hypothetical protein KGZ64_07010 [Thermaerobacter sp.]|nr:hypothetical protein [Thermaerobacter sp.]
MSLLHQTDNQVISAKMKRAMDLSHDYVRFLTEDALALRLPNVPSNSIGEQVWCIVGARESYLKAMQLGVWAGFSCSLTNHLAKDIVLAALEATSNRIMEFLQSATLTPATLSFVIDLLEHEVQHHGQLIRYSYANKTGFPVTWRERYTV